MRASRPQRELVPGREPVPGLRYRPGGEHLPDRVRVRRPLHGRFPVAVGAVHQGLPRFELFGAVAVGLPAISHPSGMIYVCAGCAPGPGSGRDAYPRPFQAPDATLGHVPNLPVSNLPLAASSNTNTLAGEVASAFSQPSVVVRTRPWPDVAWLICSMKKSASRPVSVSVMWTRSDRSRASCWVRRVPLRLATGMVTMGLRWAYRVT